MRRKCLIGILVIIFVAGLLTVVSCGKKTVKTDSSVNESETTAPAARPMQAADENNSGPRGSGLSATEAPVPLEHRIPEAQRKPSEDIQRPATAGKDVFLNELVLFDFDSSILTAAAQDRLKRKAEWLADNPGVSIIIQGHCDERGPAGYNLSLGERRAQSAKAFLVSFGVSAVRLSTVSYGKDHPFAEGHTEDVWQLNRRAHFVIE